MNRAHMLTVVVIGALIAIAYMTRYQPLPGGQPMGMQPLWDRWFHRVCFVVFGQGNRIACSVDALSDKRSSVKSSTMTLVAEVRVLREAGFNDKEIVDYVLKSESH